MTGLLVIIMLLAPFIMAMIIHEVKAVAEDEIERMIAEMRIVRARVLNKTINIDLNGLHDAFAQASLSAESLAEAFRKVAEKHRGKL